VDPNLGFFEDLSEKDRLFYGKVVLGTFVGLVAGILNLLIPDMSVLALWLIAICALLLLGLFGQKYLKIEEMEPSRVYLTGTVTYFLFFVLFWEVVLMLSASESLLPPGSF
jgi:LytS/YehU family sensor histidine kinase